MTVTDVLDSYHRAWNQTCPDARRCLLDSATIDVCELVTPLGRFIGREAMIDRLSGFSQRFPGAHLSATTNVDEHNGFGRYGWAVIDQEKTWVLEGTGVIELAADGRLRRIVMFVGQLHPM